ncbi:MAG: replication initiation factor domain-containing protein [Clostridia bacterium]|nr:replication initiation factor domain-containing protein [Clostridia bacterium]
MICQQSQFRLDEMTQYPSRWFLSVDTISYIVENCSVKMMMGLLMLDEYMGISFKRDEVTICPGRESFMYTCNGVQFFITKAYAYAYNLDPDGDDILSYPFKELRVNITGEGMKFLRKHYQSKQIWADDFLLHFISQNFVEKVFNEDGTPKLNAVGDQIEIWHGHYTRVDYALDVINDFSNIMNNMIRHLNYGTSTGEPGFFISSNGGRVYKSKIYLSDNGGKTIYLGSTQSEQMLRVYDKLAEQTDETGVWKHDPGFPGIDKSEIKTWTRFELVLRKVKAKEYTPTSSDTSSVLRFPELFVNLLYEKFQPGSNTFMPEWWHSFWRPVMDRPETIKILVNFV